MKVDIGDYPKESGHRDVNVEISNHDIWNLDNTLALVIHPALVKLKDSGEFGAMIDTNDVPEELRPDGNIVNSSGDVDDKYFKRCDYVIDEMIWTFDNIANDKEPVGEGEEFKQWNKRIDNGLRLFGKYYRGLWT